MGGPVVFLASRQAADPLRTGGKGASLARLVRAGFPVPPGFVITTPAFREPLILARQLIGSSGLEAARRRCLEWEMPERLSRAVLGAYRRLDHGPVAVRSSLVCEDSASGSCAGLLDTALDVDGETALLDAVRRILASAFGDRLWAYLGKGGADAHSASVCLAVVVQAMVKAAVSGVAFSVDPVTCRPGVVIEAVPGLGEDLAQGRVRPDRYRLGPRGDLQEALPAHHGAPLLDEPLARRLAELVASIADAAEAPQDVEWSYDGQSIYVLQARPITSLSGKQVYSRRMVSDMAPGLVKPLVWSAKYAPINENVFAPIFESVMGPGTVDPSRISTRLYSRVYVNVTAVGEILKRIGLPPNFFDMLAREDRAARRRFRLNAATILALFRLGRFVRRESGIDHRIQPFMESQQRRLEVFRTVDWTSLPPEALVARFGQLKTLHGRSQWHIVLVSLNMHVRNRMLGRMITRRWPGTDPREVIKGYGRRSTLAAFDDIGRLAAQARSLDRGLLDRMASEPGANVSAALAASDDGRRLLQGFNTFMDRFGFLSASGSDFSEPPWVETPHLIWNTIARLAGSRDAAPPGDIETGREEVLARVRAGLGPLRRRLFDRLHASTVRYMDCRERLSLLMTEETYLMRRCLLALGRRLAERGVVEQAEDVFFLFDIELDSLLHDPSEAAAARSRIAARKAEIAEHAALEPPETLCSGQRPGLEPPPDDALEFLSGIGASAGVLQGRAHVVSDPGSDNGRFGPSDILVVPFTDIGWIPLLAGVGGVVADTGGQLSHTSIIAREFGIPAVVSVPHATRLIIDGQIITIDGTAGRVYLHPEPPLERNLG
ncbi:MAG: PEP-utilizing enzyme [Vicinamibacterales bacterium]|nr:PEP-utilizing enzyme [Vicinamibacterales bacterium]